MAAKTVRLTDRRSQLDYIYNKEKTRLCEKELFPLTNINTGFIAFRQEPTAVVSFKSMRTSRCLVAQTNKELHTKPCITSNKDQLFTLEADGKITHNGLHYYNSSYIFIGKKPKTKGYALKYNKSRGTIQSSDKVCLVSYNEPDEHMTSHECDKFPPTD